MASISASSHTIPTSQFLSNVHKQLNARYAISKNHKEKLAKEIEQGLNLIKNPPKKGQDDFDPIWYKIRNITANAMGIRSTSLFHAFGEDSGQFFEKEFAQMINSMVNEYLTAFKNANNKTVQQNFTMDILTGQHRGNIQTKYGENFSDMVDMEKFFEVAKAHNLYQKNKNGEIIRNKAGEQVYQGLVTLQDKDIKTDVRGKNLMTITQDISWYTTNKFLRLVKILTNYSFSLKNYNSSKKWWEKIHLGDTNTFKAYAGVLSDLGYSAKVIENSFWRAYNCYQARHSSHGVEQHMGHIQSIYELIGLGLVFAEGQKDKVDFLIINAKDAYSVFVQSTDALAWQILNDVSDISIGKRNVFGGGSVTISGSSLGTIRR